MTIKELCMNYDCINCPFKDACYKLECRYPKMIPDGFNEPITTSIIETAKMLALTRLLVATGHWNRISDLSEEEDHRYKCSNCGNVVRHKSKLDLYTFNTWCGRCGSYNGENNG